MRSNNRRSAIPQSLRDARPDWERIARTANKADIKAKVYKGTKRINREVRHMVREQLIDIYHGKCAYCEDKELKPEVEHYRPKKEVSGVTHPGYYWLCYEWTNLLPSCRYCNTEGGKGNHFPIEGVRVSTPPLNGAHLDFDRCLIDSNELAGEQALLLNPETDEPEKHLRFNKAGKIFKLGSSKKGAQTIEVCNLNRDNLKYDRKKLIDDLLWRVKDQFTLYFMMNRNREVLQNGLSLVFKSLDQMCDEQEPFSLVAMNIRDKFNTFIARQLPTPIQRDFANTIYEEYRQENPF